MALLSDQMRPGEAVGEGDQAGDDQLDQLVADAHRVGRLCPGRHITV